MADFTKKLKELAETIGQEMIKTEPGVVAEYAVDNMTPEAVIFPRNTKQVSETVKYANREHLAIVPRGSGSKMTMGNPPKCLDLVVCTSSMDHMLDVDTANLTITVEAGVKFRDIQARLATQEDRCYLPLKDLVTEADEFICSDRSSSGCFLPIDPPYGNSATIGGIMAANSTGPRRLLYNLPRDVLLGVRFVAPNGHIVGAGGKTAKNVSGYDISKLMTGSVGTLGILCEMTFKLLPLPERMETLLLSFGSFADACSFVDAVFETKLLPAAVEIMNGSAFKTLEFKGAPGFDSAPYVAAVAFEAFEEAVARMGREILDTAVSLGAKGTAAIQEDEHRLFWLSVSDLQPSLAGRFPGLITAQLNYPISEWKEIVEFTERTLSENDIEHTILAHAGSGVCSINLLWDQGGNGSMEKVLQAMGALLARCREAGGNLVVQRAPFDLKQNLKMWGEPGPDFLVMKRVKEQLDPSGLMSPGRFVGDL